jgi:ribosomal-protein-alanine N-acetyltransferase
MLQGDRVTLRPFRADEIDWVMEARTKTGSGPVTVTGPGRERIRRRLERSGRLHDGWLDFAIVGDGRLVGEIDARRPEFAIPPGVFEIGIAMFEGSDRGKGYGREAVELLTSHLFDSGIAERVQAGTWVENAAMRRVLERLGFVNEGTMRGYMPAEDGGRQDFVLYAVTKPEWAARESA